MTSRVTVAYGDGIGPEIMEATLRVLKAGGADIATDVIEVGRKVYEEGHSSGIRPADWETIARNKVFLKAPITTPQGGGYKSLNVTLRKTLGLYANIRPVTSLHPFVATKHPELDIVIVRENEEDLYAGIEHRQTPEVYQCLKLISRPGCEKIVRYAFEYARAMGRKKVTCMTKDNIMKLTDGLFHEVFDTIRKEYPDIESNHWIIDIGSAKLANSPEDFDVVVTLNLYGDIVSDIVAEVSGSVGLAGSSNIGPECAMFEAIHGSAPDIAGKAIANPSGLLVAGVQMLQHLGQFEAANRIQKAWVRTIEDGVATADIYSEGVSKTRVSTSAFADAVIERMGQEPRQLKVASTPQKALENLGGSTDVSSVKRALRGVDVFCYCEDRDPANLGGRLETLSASLPLKLVMITNRGIKVYPGGNPETFCTDHWRCRFEVPAESSVSHKEVCQLLSAVTDGNVEFIKTELLYTFDGQPGYSLGQGQ